MEVLRSAELVAARLNETVSQLVLYYAQHYALKDITMAAIEVTVTSLDNNRLLLSGKNNYGFFSKLPERKRTDRYGEFNVPATEPVVDCVEASGAVLTFADQLAQLTWVNVKALSQTYEKIRKYVAIWKETGSIPDFVRDMPNTDERATDYQRLAAWASSAVPGYGLWMEQGTGKTMTAITAMAQLPKGSMVLVVCPKQLRYNWEVEIKDFCRRSTYVEALRGGQMARITTLINLKRASRLFDLSVGIISYDSIQGSWDALSHMTWDMGIADESQFFKAPGTNRWGFMSQLRETCKQRLSLTGTPMANTVNDMWSQFEWMGEGSSGFADFMNFKRFFGVYDPSDDKTYEKFLGMQNVPILKDIISKKTFTIRLKEALPSLPDKAYDIAETEMTAEQSKAYDTLSSSLAIDIEGIMENSDLEQSMVVNNILTMLLKLNQITSGFLRFPAVRDNDGNVVQAAHTVHFDPNPKLDLLMDILKEKAKLEKTIVWCHWVYDIEKIKAACDSAGIKAVTFYGATKEDERNDAVETFNCDDECKVFIGNPAAGGTGLNLLGFPPKDPGASECNADHTIYFSQDWSTLKRGQSESRNHRRGTRRQIRITDLMVPGTIDQQIRERVTMKRNAALEVSDIRDILKNVLTKMKA